MSFRGYLAIQAALKRIDPLADFALRFRPDIKYVRISRSDYDLIVRYKQAGICQRVPIEYRAGVPFYRELELGHDHSLGRYAKPPAVTQADLVDVCAGSP